MLLIRQDAVQVCSIVAQIVDPRPEELFTLRLTCMLAFHDMVDSPDQAHIIEAIEHLETV